MVKRKFSKSKMKKTNIIIENYNKRNPKLLVSTPTPIGEDVKEIKSIVTNTNNEVSKKLPDNIDEYFTKIEGTKEAFHSRQLFEAKREDVDLKTDLSIQEIVLINKLLFNNELLNRKGLVPIYTDFLNHYMRLKFSLDRKSRVEFVSINKTDKTDEMLTGMSNLSNITGVRK